MVRDNATSHEIDYVAQLEDILDAEVFHNPIISSKIAGILPYLEIFSCGWSSIGKSLLPTGLFCSV